MKSQLDRGPRQVEAGVALVARAQQSVDMAREKLKQARLSADEKQLQLQTREARIEELKGKLNVAASNREFSLLKEQIAADEQANLVLSDEILESLESIDTIEIEVAASEGELKQQQDDQSERIAEIESRLAVVRDDLERAESELAKHESEIPSAAKADYTRLVASRGDEALAPVEDQSCGGCYQTLTTQTVSELALSRLVRCPNCNALLYIAE